MTSELNNALRKLEENNFAFASLPDVRNDSIWGHLKSPPYNLSLPQLSALKNARFYTTCMYEYVSDEPIVEYNTCWWIHMLTSCVTECCMWWYIVNTITKTDDFIDYYKKNV